MTTQRRQVAIIGSAGEREYPLGGYNFLALRQIAYEVGKSLAERGCIVVTGGKDGIMSSGAEGAKAGGGTTVGVVKGERRGVCNQFTDIEVVTNIGNGGDALLIPTSVDGAIIIGGGVGTLKEVCGLYLSKKSMVAIKGSGGWADKLSDQYVDERKLVQIKSADSPMNAVSLLLECIEENSLPL